MQLYDQYLNFDFALSIYSNFHKRIKLIENYVMHWQT